MTFASILLAKPAKLSALSRYHILNGVVYLAAGAGLIVWPGLVQVIIGERPFVGDEAGLIRATGLTVVVIGWHYFFGGRTGGLQVVAAGVVDRLIFVPVVLLPLAIAGVFPRFFVLFTILDVSLALGALVLLNRMEKMTATSDR